MSRMARAAESIFALGKNNSEIAGGREGGRDGWVGGRPRWRGDAFGGFDYYGTFFPATTVMVVVVGGSPI